MVAGASEWFSTWHLQAIGGGCSFSDRATSNEVKFRSNITVSQGGLSACQMAFRADPAGPYLRHDGDSGWDFAQNALISGVCPAVGAEDDGSGRDIGGDRDRERCLVF